MCLISHQIKHEYNFSNVKFQGNDPLEFILLAKQQPNSPEHIGSTAIDIPIKARAVVPPASPSSPSVKCTPFAIETKQNEVNAR